MRDRDLLSDLCRVNINRRRELYAAVDPMNLRRGALAIVMFTISGVADPCFAQTQPVTLAWDSNPEQFVEGYIVYVGDGSRSYQEQYDVGNQTSFVYTKAFNGRPYFFAVAAYTAGPTISAPSEEVLFLAGAVASPPTDMSIPAQATPAPSSSREVLCASTGNADCYMVDRL